MEVGFHALGSLKAYWLTHFMYGTRSMEVFPLLMRNGVVGHPCIFKERPDSGLGDTTLDNLGTSLSCVPFVLVSHDASAYSECIIIEC